MRVFHRCACLAFLAVLAACEISLAQTNAETASQWGLLGTWKLDCSKPASRSDGDLQYVVEGGKLVHKREFGDVRDSSSVMSAIAKPDGSLELVVNFVSLTQTRQYAFMKGGDGRIQTTFNRNIDTDEFTIKDRKFTANDNPTPWLTRCR